MPLIRRRRVSLALEHVAQMAAAVAAHDLGALHAERAVGVAGDGAGDGVEEGGPAAAGLELLVGGVEGRLAGGARVDALARVVLVVLAAEGRLGALLADDAELFYGGALMLARVPSTVWPDRCRSITAVVLTWIQLRLPLAIALLHGMRHLSGVGGREQGTQEGDRGHRRAEGSWSNGRVEGGWWGSEGVVAEGVERADEGGEGRETH